MMNHSKDPRSSGVIFNQNYIQAHVPLKRMDVKKCNDLYNRWKTKRNLSKEDIRVNFSNHIIIPKNLDDIVELSILNDILEKSLDLMRSNLL